MKSILYVGILGAIAIAISGAIFVIAPTEAQMSDNATMGNMTGENMTGENMTMGAGNMTDTNSTGSISTVGGVV